MTEQRTTDVPGTLSSDYSAFYFDGHLGPPYTYEEPHWRTFFGQVADAVIAALQPRRTYDAGCAIGLFVRALLERGVDARGGDISEFAVSGAPEGLRERLEVRDLTQPFSERYDLISCIEVLEHMSPSAAQQAIVNICAATDMVLLSSTPDDFVEATHINVRPPSSWAQDFARQGFFRRTDVDASFLSPWAVVFERRELTPVEAVARYEALLAPLSREVIAKRQALLETQRELDRARGGSSAGGPGDEIEELVQQRDRAVQEREDLAADRDRLIGELVKLRDDGDAPDQLVRLALVDELIGLKAELTQARLRAGNAHIDAQVEVVTMNEQLAATHADLHHSRLQEQRLREELDAIRRSRTWKAGRAVLRPLDLARRLRRTR
jgi:SAM-dependent methyltransferase